MARRKIRIMISSRCNDRFPAGGGAGSRTLSEIRTQLKREIEAEKLFGKEAFEVWINEDEPPEPGAQDSWDLCVEQAREADLLLVLYNGNAGWSLSSGDIGICHAELMTAFSESSDKVSIVSLLDGDKTLRPSGPQNARFQEYVDRANLFRGASITTPDDAIREAKKAVREAVLNLAHHGAREVKRSRYNAGPALDWSRMDFSARQTAMRNVLQRCAFVAGKDRGRGRSVAGSRQESSLSSICYPCSYERSGSP